MENPSKPDNAHGPDPADATKNRRPYRAPRLTTYGSLGDLAQAKGGDQKDGNPSNPFSKV